MDRRTFMLLTGAAAVLPVRRPRPLRALGNLRFDLDDQRRLSLWYNGPDVLCSGLRCGAITISIYPDRVLATIRGIRFFATSEPDLLPGLSGDGPLIALVRRYQSWSACHVTSLPADATGYGAIGVTRAGRGFAVWSPARPVRPDGDVATLRFAYIPAGDGLGALTAAAAPPSSVDRERVAALSVPTGWCSWYELGAAVTEGDMPANIDFCGAHFDRRFFRYIQLDDSYQRAAVDWDTNSKFPHGHRWLTDRVHANRRR